MKHLQNINLISLLNPDFIGFIFYSYSPRFLGVSFPIEFSFKVKKIGVFVNSPIEYLIKNRQKYNIEYVQLHGDEKIKFCEELYRNNISIIKVFKINDFFSFSYVQKFTNYSIFFLFDTHSLEYGGSGIKFSWNKILEYTFDTQFLLSGGIGTEDIKKIKKIFNIKFFGIDLNSKFEILLVNKNRDELRRFLYKIKI